MNEVYGNPGNSDMTMRKTGKENIVSFYKEFFAQLPGGGVEHPRTKTCVMVVIFWTETP
jgi:hypothetical protein